MKTTITQDVVRTFPEIDFFQSKSMQEMMCNILFHFARENPKLAYKQVTITLNLNPIHRHNLIHLLINSQGMHELLAPILFVVNSDQQALLHAKDLHLLE